MVDLEIEALAARADQIRRRSLYERLRHVWRRRTILAYRKLFLGEDGNVTADGALVIADFSRAARLGNAEVTAATDAEMRERNGRRAIALHIIARLDLDGTRLRDLGRKLRETEHE